MTRAKPVIGVTVSRRSAWRVFPLFALNIWLAGGRAVQWRSAADVDVDGVDGIVIGGGDDIAPTLYGGELRVEARLDHARDALERWILEAAFDREMPILGVCRGAQMLNIVLGGTLEQDAYGRYGSRRYRTILPRRSVQIEEESRLRSIVGAAPMRVNALHKQAVDTLGNGLRIAARDEKGMVQAIERTRDPFAIGVQWHPEHIFYARRHLALFRALIAAARAFKGRRSQTRAAEKISEDDPIFGELKAE
ncbi:gamma-glutamyl-gamma-aminobutyrate hydrolase family protein [Gymnodinialimonas sp. 2305UL16-5]|uniref:gamma-glutamyl-gamma-aminobutyrate hydrolase family protein n=1 Tax=Gymnodinialimonas mytili TaxID=3126503 RepID=UPI0030AE32F7